MTSPRLFLTAVLAVAFVTSAMAAAAFSDDQKSAIAHLGAVTGTGLACGYGKVALPLKEAVVKIANQQNMDSETREAVRDMFAKARDEAFQEAGKTCPSSETYDVTAELARVRIKNAFAQ